MDTDGLSARPLGPLLLSILLAFLVSGSLAARHYEAFPATAMRGEEIEISITSEGCEDEGRHDLKNMRLDAPEGVGIAVDTLFAEDCLLAGKVIVAKSARAASIKLWVRPGSSSPIVDPNTETGDSGYADFSITATSPEPLPPGLDAQVEVMWKVLPRSVVHDSFGSRVAKRYYGVEVVIGNNSGFDLQLAAVGFSDYTLEECNSPPTLDSPTIPVDSYQIVRGSLERAQEFGSRHIFLSSLKSAGLIMTGFLPFYGAQSRARSNYFGFTNIVNNPLVSGIEAIFPDTTINQLRRLDIQALRDGIIIPHNTHQRTMAFISKRALYCSPKKPSDNTPEVTSALGKLVLIGNQVQYLQRVQVVANGPGNVTPPPVVMALPAEEDKIPRGKDGKENTTGLILRGSNLNDAVVEAPANVAGIRITRQEVNDAGDEIKIQVTVAEEVDLGRYRLKVTTPNGSAEVEVQIVDAG